MKKVIFIIAATVVTFNCFAQWSEDPNVNNAICIATNDQENPQLVSDGSGGAINYMG